MANLKTVKERVTFIIEQVASLSTQANRLSDELSMLMGENKPAGKVARIKKEGKVAISSATETVQVAPAKRGRKPKAEQPQVQPNGQDGQPSVSPVPYQPMVTATTEN